MIICHSLSFPTIITMVQALIWLHLCNIPDSRSDKLNIFKKFQVIIHYGHPWPTDETTNCRCVLWSVTSKIVLEVQKNCRTRDHQWDHGLSFRALVKTSQFPFLSIVDGRIRQTVGQSLVHQLRVLVGRSSICSRVVRSFPNYYIPIQLNFSCSKIII